MFRSQDKTIAKSARAVDKRSGIVVLHPLIDHQYPIFNNALTPMMTTTDLNATNNSQMDSSTTLLNHFTPAQVEVNRVAVDVTTTSITSRLAQE